VRLDSPHRKAAHTAAAGGVSTTTPSPTSSHHLFALKNCIVGVVEDENVKHAQQLENEKILLPLVSPHPFIIRLVASFPNDAGGLCLLLEVR
jgi:hypothetical protein